MMIDLRDLYESSEEEWCDYWNHVYADALARAPLHCRTGTEMEMNHANAEVVRLSQQLAAALLWKEAVEHDLIVAGATGFGLGTSFGSQKKTDMLAERR